MGHKLMAPLLPWVVGRWKADRDDGSRRSEKARRCRLPGPPWQCGRRRVAGRLLTSFPAGKTSVARRADGRHPQSARVFPPGRDEDHALHRWRPVRPHRHAHAVLERSSKQLDRSRETVHAADSRACRGGYPYLRRAPLRSRSCRCRIRTVSSRAAVDDAAGDHPLPASISR